MSHNLHASQIIPDFFTRLRKSTDAHYDDKRTPTPDAFKRLAVRADILSEAIEKFDGVLGGRRIAQTRDRLDVLTGLCDALRAVWDVQASEDGTAEPILLHREVAGYGDITEELGDTLDDLERELERIGEVIMFLPDHFCLDAWEWRIRTNPDSDGTDGEIVAWWAPPDELDVEAAKCIERLPDNSLFWKDCRDSFEEILQSRNKVFSTAQCLQLLNHGESMIASPNALNQELASAVLWATHRRQMKEPQHDAFGDAATHPDGLVDFAKADWGLGLFDSENERWPVLEAEIQECYSNARFLANFACDIIHTSLEREKRQSHVDQTSAAESSRIVEWSDWRMTNDWAHNVFHMTWGNALRKLKKVGIAYEKEPRGRRYKIDLAKLRDLYPAASL